MKEEYNIIIRCNKKDMDLLKKWGFNIPKNIEKYLEDVVKEIKYWEEKRNLDNQRL